MGFFVVSSGRDLLLVLSGANIANKVRACKRRFAVSGNLFFVISVCQKFID